VANASRVVRIIILIISVSLTTSCWFGRKKTLPLPPAQAPIQIPTDAKTPERIEQPPEILVQEPPKPAVETPPQFPQPDPPVEPEPTERPRRRPPGSSPSQHAPAQTPAGQPNPAEPPANVPQLAPVLTDEQRREYDNTINALISRTTHNISRARMRRLSGAELDMIARAESFIAQAQKTQKLDPAASKSLAERAELLTLEVLKQ
jgi:hypothetical protein